MRPLFSSSPVRIIILSLLVSAPLLYVLKHRNSSAPAPTAVVSHDGLPSPQRVKSSEEGDASAQFSLALDYQQARGIPEDKTKAVYWYEKSAAQGYAKAQNNLGNMYYHAEGVPRDLAKAKYWYEKAAAQDQVDALHNIGRFYRVEEKKYDVALEWYKKAIAKGSGYSMLDMGLLYEQGLGGLPKDPKLAMEWYQKAANAGQPIGENNIGAMYHNGEGVPVDYVQAREWYLKAAQKGEPIAQRNLGGLYLHGLGVPMNHIEAAKWYQLAADKNDAQALAAMAYMRYAGLGGPVDNIAAADLYEKAAKAGDIDAMQTVSWFYEEGRGVQADQALANQWRRKAFEESMAKYKSGEHDGELLTNIGNAYYRGYGTAQNKATAMPYYVEAAKQGHYEAEYMIGAAYFNGEAGYAQDYAKGVEWFLKSADHNNLNAYRYLAYAYCTGKGVERSVLKSREWVKKAAALGDPEAQRMASTRMDKELLAALADVVLSTSSVFHPPTSGQK